MSYEVELLPAQRKFWEIDHNNKIDVAVYQGGFGSGKTFAGSLLGITLAIKYPRVVGLVGAQTVGLLRDTTLATYIEHLDNLGIEYNFVKSENKLLFENGSEILFRHLEEPDKLKSLNLGFVEIEEMSDIPYDTFKVLLSRLRQKVRPEWKGFRHRLFGHTNPQVARGWIYQEFVKNPKAGFRRILAPSTQNPHLPEGYLDLLKATYNEEYYRIMVLGEDDDNVTGLVTRGYNNDVQTTNLININPKYPIHLTCDFNVDPMCWYLAQHYDGNVYYLYEIVRNNASTDGVAQAVCDILKEYKDHPIIINGDASGDNNTTKGNDYIFIRNAFRRNSFTKVDVRLMHKNPPIEWRLSCWNNMIKGPDGKHHIFVHPQCKYLLYNIENLEVKAGTSKPKLPSPSAIQKDINKKYLGHPIDAASYLVCMYYPIKEVHFQEVPESKNIGTDIFNGKYDKRLM